MSRTAALSTASEALSLAGIGTVRLTGGWLMTDATARVRLALPQAIRPAAFLRLIGRDDRRGLLALARRGGTGEAWMACADGTRRRVRIATDGRGLATLTEITAEHEALAALRKSEEHLRYTVEYNPQLPWVADPSGQIIDLTDRWLSATGMTREQALGAGWLAHTHPDDLADVQGQVVAALTTGAPFDVRARLKVNDDYRWMRAQGFPRRDEAGAIVCWYGYTEDVHEAVLAEERVRWTAEHDPLTGLYNRALFNQALEKGLAQAIQSLKRLGVLLLDIDHFKEVNDLFGHHAGDHLLQRYAEQLRAVLPPEAIVARLGGDEFAILFPSVTDAEELVRWGEQILQLRDPISTSGGSLDCRASIGAALFPEHGRLCSELLRHADIALYAAKENGRCRLQLFEWEMQEEVRARVAMVNRARTAAEGCDILAFYQPKVSLETGSLAGFEALLRWRDANGRIQPPGAIQAAFEETEVADKLGYTMLHNVLGDMARWTALGLDYGSVAINAAPAEFRHAGFAPRLIRAVRDAGLSPHLLEVEVTEGVFLGRGSDQAKAAIAELDAAGHRIVLDDFGTGFASLSHLRQLPVDTLKIDRSFVARIIECEDDRAIVSALTGLGRALGIKVVAEGIETRQQADTLRAIGCDVAQGYWFGRPMPAEKVPDLIRSWDGTPRAEPLLMAV